MSTDVQRCSVRFCSIMVSNYPLWLQRTAAAAAAAAASKQVSSFEGGEGSDLRGVSRVEGISRGLAVQKFYICTTNLNMFI